MFKYIVTFEGSGDGCDYTIGCNVTWREFEASSMEDAIQGAKEIILEYSPDHISIKRATVYQISEAVERLQAKFGAK